MPPASMPPKTPRMEWSRKYGVSRPMPFATTVHETEISGTSATRNAATTRPVATRSVIRRRRSVPASMARVSAWGSGTARVSGVSVVMSVGPREVLAARDDRAGGHVDRQGDDEQREPRGDQGADAQRVRLRELQGDVRRDGLVLAGLEQMEGVQGAGAQEHQHGHGLAQRAAQAEHGGRDDARAPERQNGHPDHLPPGRAQRQGRLLVQARRLEEPLAADG